MRQKHRMLSFVRVQEDDGSSFDAIVRGSYLQICGGGDYEDYDVLVVVDGRVIDERAWYNEDQLTQLPEQDRDKAEEMLEEWFMGGGG